MLVRLQLKCNLGKFDKGQQSDFVYEAVVKIPVVKIGKEWQPLVNNYVHIAEDVSIVVAGRRFTVRGSYFCQRDEIDCCCSQASVRMAIFHVPIDLDILPYREMYKIVEEIRQTDPKYKKHSLAPRDGFCLKELEGLLASQGVKALTYNRSWKIHRDTDPYEYAYLLVESGIPTLIAFSPRFGHGRKPKLAHLIPVIGHTMNTDEWLPIAHSLYRKFEGHYLTNRRHRYISSASWVSHLIVHDDSMGPYHCLGERDLIETRHDGRQKEASLWSRIMYVIGLVPSLAGFTISPHHAQNLAVDFFYNLWKEMLDDVKGPWKKRFEQRPFDEKTLVVRTQSVRWNEYVGELQDAIDHEGNPSRLSKKGRRKLEEVLPEIFWMMEFSIPEIFSVNRAKFGEVLLKFNPTDRELKKVGSDKTKPSICIGFRFINHIKLMDGTAFTLGFRSHCKLFRWLQRPMEY